MLTSAKYYFLVILKPNPSILKTQGEDTFLKNNFVTFVSTFLIERAIRHSRFYFRMQDLCLNVSETDNIWSYDLFFCDNCPLKNTFNATTTPLTEFQRS